MCLSHTSVASGDSIDDIVHVDSVGDVHKTWLRENCRCENCYNAATRQRNVLTHRLEAPALRPASVSSDGGQLVVIWEDGHCSQYDLAWLRSVVPPAPVDRTAKVLWDAATIVDRVTAVHYASLLRDDSALTELLSALVTYGFALVADAPADIESTRQAAERVCHVQQTLFGRMWAFTSDMARDDTAYTNIELGAHTDNSYLAAPAGLQVFQCLRHDGSGGETLLVDGFHAAEQLRAQHPDDFRFLCDTAVYHEYLEPGHYMRNLAPVLTTQPVTGALTAIRYNHYDRALFRATATPEAVGRFYDAIAELSGVVERPESEHWMKLNPGMILIVDNWRVMHGRAAFTGRRDMCGCYLPRDDWLSKARVLGLL